MNFAFSLLIFSSLFVDVAPWDASIQKSLNTQEYDQIWTAINFLQPTSQLLTERRVVAVGWKDWNCECQRWNTRRTNFEVKILPIVHRVLHELNVQS
jgi:hypothetical protein